MGSARLGRDRPAPPVYDPTVIRAVAVVVVTHNSESHIGSLLDSLPAALGGLSWRTIVVDNGSTDGTLDVLGLRTDCTVIRSTNTGFAAGVNQGARSAGDADAVLVVNPDATLAPGAVPTMAAVLAKPGVGIVAPRITEHDGSLSPTLRRRPTLGRAGGLSFTKFALFAERVEDPSDYRREHPVDWAVGAVLLIARACYDALGGFDESFFLYSEETDFCLRGWDQSWLTVYTPAAGAMHIGGGSGETATTHTMKMVNRVRMYRRRHDDPRAWVYFWLVVATEVRRGLLGNEQSWVATRALLRPSLRPPQLGCGDAVLPR